MNFVRHYLRSEDTLPPSSYVVDPFDHERYVPDVTSETLTDFINRIDTSRDQKDTNPLVLKDLRDYVIESLYQNANTKDKKEYFVEEKVHPSRHDFFNFLNAVITAVKKPETVPLAKQRERAKKHCLNNCMFHQGSTKMRSGLVNWVSRMIGIQDVGTYPEEELLGRCTACGCGLAAKVKYPLQAALASITPDEIDKILVKYKDNSFDKCWILKEALEIPSMRELLLKKMTHGVASGSAYLNTYDTRQRLIQINESKNTKV